MMSSRVATFVQRIILSVLIALSFGTSALADVTSRYRGKDVQNFEANATVTFRDRGPVTIDVNVLTKGTFVYSGTLRGTEVEGNYTAPPGFGGGYFKATLSGAPSGNNVPNSITVLHGRGLQWPLQLTMVPGGAIGGDGGETVNRPQLQAAIICDPNPLAVTVSELPSKTCTVWISNWKHDTSALVQVIAPQSLDGYGNHANGIQVFSAGQTGSTTGVAPSNMSGFRAPDGSYGKSYPWKLTVFACPSQQGTGANCFNYSAKSGPFSVPLIVRQAGSQDANIALTGTVLASARVQAGGGNSNAVLWRIRNIWKEDQFINIEPGYLRTSQISTAWWSAQWRLEPVAGTQFVRIGNRWKADQYIHIENGLTVGSAPEHWHSAMWSIEPVAGASGQYRIRNRWKPDQFLNIESGTLQCTAINNTWWSAMWSLEK